MRRLWFTPRYLGLTVLAILFAIGCVLLGNWQWSRHQDKVTRATAIEQNYSAAPRPIESVLPTPSSSLTPQQQWTRVTWTTTYDVSRTFYARNRPNEGTYGFEVLGLALAPGGSIIVNRGWAPYGTNATVLPAVAQVPSGPVVLTGWLRSGEPDLDKDLPDNQLASINPTVVAEASGALVHEAYLVLDPAAPGGASATASGMAPLERPVGDLGPNQAYAYQWWLVSPLGFVLLLQLLRVGTADERAAPRREPRPKKVRIWDEEDA